MPCRGRGRHTPLRDEVSPARGRLLRESLSRARARGNGARRAPVFDFRCLSELLRCGQWVEQASFHHFPFDGFFFSLLGANVAIVANAAAGIVRTSEAAHDLVTGQDELLVIHVVDVRVSDGSAAAQAYACDGRCKHQFSLLCFFHLWLFHVFLT